MQGGHHHRRRAGIGEAVAKLFATEGIEPGDAILLNLPILFPIFGPIFTLGAVFLLVRSLLSRAFDRWFAAGYAAMIVL